MSTLLKNGSILTVGPFILNIDVDYSGVLTTFTPPAGLTFDSYTSNIGTVNIAGTEWTIPTYVKDFAAEVTLVYEITDITLFSALAPEDRKVTGYTTDLTGEVVLVDNAAEKLILGITCADIIACIADLEEYDTMDDAVADLGDGAMFLYSLENLDGATYRGLHVTPL